MSNKAELEKRRTFAVIAHPDAGKTTLTEKLLLFGGAIQTAGAVKSNKIKKTTSSDFMEIEKQRGISVATSVMGFDYRDKKIRILDTPGHKDFAEDTYRTLTAVDSVIVVIDVAKGVEAQTERLVEVCRMRSTPVIVFVNKLDRVGKEAFDLLDEIETKLKLNVHPLSWPVGMGQDLKGVYNLYEKKLCLFSAHGKQNEDESIVIDNLADEALDKHCDNMADQLREDVELIEGVYEEFDTDAYLNGNLSPVFFGSAVNNFGVKEMLDCFVDIAPEPKGTTAEERDIIATEDKFSGFVFKIHANMDPKHRDRLAFIRISSGKFERGKNYHHVRLGKNMKFSSPTAFMAAKKDIVDEAFPGDIIGIHDTGNFKIGDTLTEGEKLHVKGMPSFSPELFRYIDNADPMKSKQLNKGVDQLMDEGVAQLFTATVNNRKIIGCVGLLQFDVIQYRLENEYGAKCTYEPISLHKACWVTSENEEALKDFKRRKMKFMAIDKDGKDVYLSNSSYGLQMDQDEYKNIEFHYTSETD